MIVDLHNELTGSGIYVAHVAINSWIGDRATIEQIAALYGTSTPPAPQPGTCSTADPTRERPTAPDERVPVDRPRRAGRAVPDGRNHQDHSTVDKLIKRLPWVEDFARRTPHRPRRTGRGLGLILPGAFTIAAILTPLAATGLGIIMVLAMGVHARRREPQAIAFNAVLLAAAALIAWGRFGPYAF
jgi:DoxX-like family